MKPLQAFCWSLLAWGWLTSACAVESADREHVSPDGKRIASSAKATANNINADLEKSALKEKKPIQTKPKQTAKPVVVDLGCTSTE